VKRFFGNVLIVNALIAEVIGLIGWSAEWEASDYTLAVIGGVFGAAVDDVATSESVQSQFAQGAGFPKGDFYGRWRARQGETPGPRTFSLMLATSLTAGTAALVSWKVFE
jgi:hypothetical protein